MALDNIKKALEKIKEIRLSHMERQVDLYWEHDDGTIADNYPEEIRLLEQAVDGLELMGSFAYKIECFVGQKDNTWIFFDGMEGENMIPADQFKLLSSIFPEKTWYTIYSEGQRIEFNQEALKPFRAEIPLNNIESALMTPVTAMDWFKAGNSGYVKLNYTRSGSVVLSPTDDPKEAVSVEELKKYVGK